MTLASVRQAEPALEPIVIGREVPGMLMAETPGALAGLIGPRGGWLCPVMAGDRLAPTALRLYEATITINDGASLVYADDDLCSIGERRLAPHFKPAWNPPLFEHHDFVTGSAALFATPAILAVLPEEGWAEELTRGVLAHEAKSVRMPFVAHHRQSRPDPRPPARHAAVLPDPAPRIAAIIPTRDHADLLSTVIEGVRESTLPFAEIIVVDNGSENPEALAYLEALEHDGIVVLRRPGPFNYSALNNAAAAITSAELLCFLNNDVEMIDRTWLTHLAARAQAPDIGAVGARLLYPDGTLQHGGVFTGLGGGAGHAHRHLPNGERGYFDRSRLPQLVSAVTGACLVVARNKFAMVGGFDEAVFPVAFNDVDLCLKLNARGWQSFYEPRATLIHHESKSRGLDVTAAKRKRFAGELEALKDKWQTDNLRDPFHHPQLSPFTEEFVISV